MIPFWCACWMAWQTWMKSLKPLARGTCCLVAVIRDLHPAHQFHHEEGPARFGRAGIQNFGDVRVIHQRERLAFGLEAGDDLLVSMPSLITLSATRRRTGSSCSAI